MFSIYVALSHVCTLSGVYWTEFDQDSIFVCSKSLQEFNRLRELYRPDLPMYKIAMCGKKESLVESVVLEVTYGS